MDTPFSLAEKIFASVSIGLLIGLEREWAHKEAGVRSFAVAALLGTISWLVAPSLAFLEVGVMLVIILFVNLFSLREHQPLEITTSLALAATNVLGILVGTGAYFLAFTSAISPLPSARTTRIPRILTSILSCLFLITSLPLTSNYIGSVFVNQLRLLLQSGFSSSGATHSTISCS